MGKRGPRSKVTQDIVEIIKQRYHGGASHRAIADELKISETNIRRILSQHSIPKRDRKLATLLSAAEEDTLVEFLISQKNFRGKYRDLRDLMENFARERDMRCPFTYSWRNGFVKRHSHNRQIPIHLLQLLSPKNEKTKEVCDPDYEDPDLSIISRTMQAKSLTMGVIPATTIDINAIQNTALLKTVTAPPMLKGPSVWRQKPKLTQAQRAIKESTKAFLKAGLSKEEASELLMKLKVPGLMVETSQDVVAAAISDVFGETEREPELTLSQANAAVEHQTAHAVMIRKANRRTPQKKDQLQVELLEKVFEESPVCGDLRAKKLASILGLTPAQIIYWFHNTARHKRKQIHPNSVVDDASVVTEETHDFNMVPLYQSS